MVDMQDVRDERITMPLGLWRVQAHEALGGDGAAEPVECHTAGEVRGGRCEDVAPMEGCAWRRQLVTRIVERHGYPGGLGGKDIAEETIVGTDEDARCHLHRHGAARAADTRIDDKDEDAAFAEIAPARIHHPGSANHILRRDLMRDVHETNVRCDAEHDPLHDANITVAGTEICQQCDEWCVWHSLKYCVWHREFPLL